MPVGVPSVPQNNRLFAVPELKKNPHFLKQRNVI